MPCPGSRAPRSTASPCARPTPTVRPRECRATSTWPVRRSWAVRRRHRYGRAARWRSPQERRCRRAPTRWSWSNTRQAATSELIEVLRPAAPGDGVVGADEDAAAGGPIARAGRALRAHDVGMLAAAGITELVVHARPRVAVVSTGDELVPHRHGGPRPRPGARRHLARPRCPRPRGRWRARLRRHRARRRRGACPCPALAASRQ